MKVSIRMLSNASQATGFGFFIQTPLRHFSPMFLSQGASGQKSHPLFLLGKAIISLNLYPRLGQRRKVSSYNQDKNRE
jgi:hypothetical protein